MLGAFMLQGEPNDFRFDEMIDVFERIVGGVTKLMFTQRKCICLR